jgi:hypothetical protein
MDDIRDEPDMRLGPPVEIMDQPRSFAFAAARHFVLVWQDRDWDRPAAEERKVEGNVSMPSSCSQSRGMRQLRHVRVVRDLVVRSH